MGGNLLFGSLARGGAAETPVRTVAPVEVPAGVGHRRTWRSLRSSGSAPKLRPGEGRLALVLPATVCTGPSWGQTRALIQRDFNLDMVISSHDPLRWNFSDSTDLSEALLVATRRPDGGDAGERRTTFVNLWQNPDGVLDAHRVAQAITAATPADFERQRHGPAGS